MIIAGAVKIANTIGAVNTVSATNSAMTGTMISNLALIKLEDHRRKGMRLSDTLPAGAITITVKSDSIESLGNTEITVMAMIATIGIPGILKHLAVATTGAMAAPITTNSAITITRKWYFFTKTTKVE